MYHPILYLPVAAPTPTPILTLTLTLTLTLPLCVENYRNHDLFAPGIPY